MRRGTVSWFPVSKHNVNWRQGWVSASLMLATLFFNFFFWMEPGWRFSFLGPSWLYFAELSGAAVMLTGLFFLGPATAMKVTGKSLFNLAGLSLGSAAGMIFRFCCAAFLFLWVIGFVGLSVFTTFEWAYRNRPALWQLVLVTAVILLALGSARNAPTNAILALVTNAVAIGLLVYALQHVLIRIPGTWHDFVGARTGRQEVIVDSRQRLEAVLAYAAPWAVLGANFVKGQPVQRKPAIVGFFGIAVPLIVSTIAAGLASEAAHKPFRNIAGALWAGNSDRFYSLKVALAGITLLGPACFALGGLSDAFSMLKDRPFARTIAWTTIIAGSSLLAPLISNNRLDFDMLLWLGRFARPIGTVGAIITADMLLGTSHQSSRRFEPVGVLAFLVGLAAPCYLPALTPTACIPELLSSYAVAFIACVVGRGIERL